jgi:hypothetical protein
MMIMLRAGSLHAVELSTVPLDTLLVAPRPNLMAVVDHSTVMDAEILTTESDGLFQGRAYIFVQDAYHPASAAALGAGWEIDPSLRKDWRSQWNGYNQIYYHPQYNYCPWPGTEQYTFHQADPQRPWSNPLPSMDGYARLHLAEPFFTVISRHEAIIIPNAHYFSIEDLNGNGTWERGEPVYLTIWVDHDGDGLLDVGTHSGIDHRRYYRFLDDGDGLVEDDELVLITSETERNRIRPEWHDPGGAFLRFKSDREDLQNFANWVTYYRRRLLAVKAVTARFLAGLKTVNAGLYPSNGLAPLAVQPINPSIENTVIVDNQDADFSISGTWHTFNGGHAWSGTAIYSNQEGAVAVYRPDLFSEGQYEISAWWPCGGMDMGDVRVSIHLNQGDEIIAQSVNQSQNGPDGCGQWFRLGVWRLPAGNDSSVQFICDRDGSYIFADSVKFTRLDDAGKNPDYINDLLNHLYGLTPQGEKNLRFALDQVGRYLDRNKDSGIGPSPLEAEEKGGGCQYNLAVMVSDGIWNGRFSGVGNADGDQVAPYADPWANTLADVAMYYFDNDLDAGLPDQVAGGGCDSAAHQHMTTFAIALGGQGNVDPYDMNSGGRTDDPDDQYDPCFHRSTIPDPQWPQPVANHISCVDDFHHAAINGRGGYNRFPNTAEKGESGGFQAKVGRLSEAVRTGKVSGELTADNALLEDGSIVYKTLYYAGSWTGDVMAFRNATDSKTIHADKEEAIWSAAEHLDGFRKNPDARRVITYDESDGETHGKPFRYHFLSDVQKKMLGSDLRTDSAADCKASALLDYLRGGEDEAFRRRETCLGDIVNSSPLVVGRTLYVGANDGMLHAFDTGSGEERFAYVPNNVFGRLADLGAYGYEQSHRFYVDGTPAVGDVAVDQFHRDTLLVGGFGKGGQGYYCLRIRRRTRTRSDNTFSPYEDDFNVDDFGDNETETSISHMVLWEYPGPNPAEDEMDNDGDGFADEQGEYDPDIGYSLGQGYAVNANVPGNDGFRPVVIFPNGYNSASRKAVLYILDAITGELIRKIDTGTEGDNGLSIPALIDVDSDRCVDYAYAGDLKGNLWKFDLSSETPEKWGVAYGEDMNQDGVIDASDGDIPMPLFSAVCQAITSRPDVMFTQNACAPKAAGYMVIFGTGRYLGLSDKTDIRQQSIYGLWDFGDDSDDSESLGYLTDRTDGTLSSGLRLVPQVISSQDDVEGTEYRRFEKDHAVTYCSTEDITDGDGHDANDDGNDPQPNPVRDAGWFFDFPIAPDTDAVSGERVVSDVAIRGGRAIVTSYVPESQPCAAGGSAWLYLVDGCFSESATENYTPKNDQLSIMTALKLDHRLTARSFFFKEHHSILSDQLLIPDQNGHILKIPFSGEVWGKSYWRQNLQ